VKQVPWGKNPPRANHDVSQSMSGPFNQLSSKPLAMGALGRLICR